MKVSQVWIKEHESGALRGFANVSFCLDGSGENHMRWNGLKIFQNREGGIDIAMPAERDKSGKTDDSGQAVWWDTIRFFREEDNVGPVSTLWEHIRQEVEVAYNKLMSSGGNSKQEPTQQGPSNHEDPPAADDIPF